MVRCELAALAPAIVRSVLAPASNALVVSGDPEVEAGSLEPVDSPDVEMLVRTGPVGANVGGNGTAGPLQAPSAVVVATVATSAITKWAVLSVGTLPPQGYVHNTVHLN